MVTSNILTLVNVLLTAIIASSDAAAGDWTNPVISNDGGAGTLPQTVPENHPPGRQTNAFVAAKGATSYRILSQDVDGLFVLQANGSINTTSRLNYESVTSYTLVVERIESVQVEVEHLSATGVNVRTTATVTIKIEDKNDNRPAFSDSSYFVRLPNNSAEGTFVTKAVATDADSTLYFRMIQSYTIQKGLDGKYFFIVPSSGEVYVAKDRVLSSTDKANYTFKVAASDTGSPTLTGSADVTVCVTCPSPMRSGGGGVHVPKVPKRSGGGVHVPNAILMALSLLLFMIE